MSESNPLKAYFRQPSIFIKLPSNGKYWPKGSIDIPVTGEIGVMPMTAKDEITMKTPDALMNGQAVVDVIQSCIPAIKDAWKCPTIDMEMILAAIRIASYGEGLELSTLCPCEKKVSLEYKIDLRTIVDFLSNIKFDDSVTLDNGLRVNIKPLDYAQLSKAQLKIWEQQKIFTAVNDEKLADDQKLKIFNESFAKLTNMTIENFVAMIDSIETNDQIVNNKEYITEFIQNAGRDIYNQFETKMEEIKSATNLKPMKVKCTEPGCDKEFDLPISLDQSNFFE